MEYPDDFVYLQHSVDPMMRCVMNKNNSCLKKSILAVSSNNERFLHNIQLNFKTIVLCDDTWIPLAYNNRS